MGKVKSDVVGKKTDYSNSVCRATMTIVLPESLKKEMKLYAIKQDKTVSEIFVELAQDLLRKEYKKEG